MDLGLSGKTALVCAASRGLGFAVAAELAVEGANVAICSRSQDGVEEAAVKIRAATPNARVIGVAGDISVPADLERLVETVANEFGGIDILVTNGGGPPAGNFDQISSEQWQQATELVLDSVVNLTRLVLPGMKSRRFGRILNVTSIASKQPVENLMLSNSLRAAVTGFAKTLADEVAADGITVNNILPGYTRTERLEELIGFLSDKEGLTPDEVKNRWHGEIPMKRLGEPREFAALAAFLVSERASYITGSSIAVDGGWMRGLF
jgi:3-oxoacyl-[acyl-carrier protein] reductase